MGGEVLGEGLEFGLGEAVEEEVGDDEVGGWELGVPGDGGTGGVGGWKEVQGGGLQGSEAGDIGVATAAQEVKHGGAGVYGEDAEVGPAFKEAGEEAAVAVAEYECLVARWELGEVVGAGALQEGTKAKVFGEPVDAGYVVEIGLGWLPGRHRTKGRKRSGVRRTRSAAARRWMGERRRR